MPVSLAGKKKSRQWLKKLFEGNKTDEVLRRLRRMIKKIGSRRIKKQLAEFYVYAVNNRQGIEASTRARMDKKTESAGAADPDIDKLIARRFKRRGMSRPEQSKPRVGILRGLAGARQLPWKQRPDMNDKFGGRTNIRINQYSLVSWVCKNRVNNGKVSGH